MLVWQMCLSSCLGILRGANLANLAIKRKKLLLYLKQKKVDVCFLQETHLDNEESTKLQRDWVGKIFYSAYSSSQRSVGILIRKNVNVTIHKQLSDREGRWVAISADLFGSGCSLINIYAPNIDCPDFFANICCVATIGECLRDYWGRF